MLPSGVEYAERGPIAANVVPLRRRERAPALDLECTPEDIDGDLAEAAD